MATINLLEGEKNLHHNRGGNVKTPYLVERTIDIGKLTKKKGSALTTGDIVQALKVPAQSYIMGVFAGKGTDVDATTMLISVGGVVGSAALVFNPKGTASVAGAPLEIVYPGDDQVAAPGLAEVTLTFTGNLTKGVIRVSVLVLDLSRAVRGELAKYGEFA